MSQTPRLLVKLRPQSSLAAAQSRANLRPLLDVPSPGAAFGLAATTEPQWFLADVPDFGPTPWDTAHAQVAQAIGLDESSILFAEPDLPQSFPTENEANPGGNAFALMPATGTFSDQKNGDRPQGPGFAWHLGDNYSQLAKARDSVAFQDRRTRIAHIDTGYDPTHSARPVRILHDLEHNFVDSDGNPNSAADPNRGFIFDQSGHGTGTIGLLAGQAIPQNNNQPIGGAPEADIVPLRIANSVVMFWTSAFSAAIQYAVANGCDVVSISMGGVPSAAWNDTVNAAYEAGVCIVAASGDCFDGLPTHHVVYPARYHRTIAACGVMANGAPYFGLPPTIIEGNWGPDSAMTEAMAAYAPNTPWAKFGCPNIVGMDGAGTSSSTPQIAAAVALWYEKYKAVLPRDWRRIEAARNALFTKALNTDPEKLGRGTLRAFDALSVTPRFDLAKTPADDDSFPILSILTGFGIAEPSPRERMLGIELMQRSLLNPEITKHIPDRVSEGDLNTLKQAMDALIADPHASQTLRRAVAARYPAVFGTSVKGIEPLPDLAPQRAIANLEPIDIPEPPCRRLRTYAIDPSFSTFLDTATLNTTRVEVRWEPLKPGPEGEYIKVDDTDADGTKYQQIDLNDPRLIAQDGLEPSEGNPLFHQQMVYVVAMQTIARFEQALGRKVLWRPIIDPAKPFDDSGYQQRLTIRPHALRQENAFYDPSETALKFGYFRAAKNDPGDHVPGTRVYTCLSQDIITHETTHAILDGIHRRFSEPTNPDVLAFHEAFADVAALMQHFGMRELLANQIARSCGNLEAETLLGSLAVQFGKASGRPGALRDAIGTVGSDGVWRRLTPDPSAYQNTQAPHARGALLVATIFDAFIAIYKSRTADLYRIYTGGTGVLPTGAIHPDFVNRLCDEAVTAASHVFLMCVRALDYIPPVDLTFGEYLRGIITADTDLFSADPFGYRVAMVEAFRRRGIVPADLDTLSVETARWRGVDLKDPERHFAPIVRFLKKFADECLYIEDREKLFRRTRQGRAALQPKMSAAAKADPEIARVFGIDPDQTIEVHELRRAERTDLEGRTHPQVIVALTQHRTIEIPGASKPQPFFGGATLVVDLKAPRVEYAIRKRVDHAGREADTRAFLTRMLRNPLTAPLLDSERTDRFAVLHALADLER
jgi:hypothetical protein